MSVLAKGINPLFMDPDPDKAREFFAKKSRALSDKRMTEKEAVEKFIPDGCYIATGGFGANRIPTAVLHEILRARRKNLGFYGLTTTHDFQLMCAGKCIDRVDCAYVVGLEARGLSPNARRVMESGDERDDDHLLPGPAIVISHWSLVIGHWLIAIAHTEWPIANNC